MIYHTPDPCWAVFNAADFESYAKVFVVEGRFHKDVPEDVRDASRGQRPEIFVAIHARDTSWRGSAPEQFPGHLQISRVSMATNIPGRCPFLERLKK